MTLYLSYTSFQPVVTSKSLKVELGKVAVAFQTTLLCQKGFKYKNHALSFLQSDFIVVQCN